MRLTDDEAKSFGVETNHERMINGEHRFRLNHVDGSSYCRTEATDAGWQNSHYHIRSLVWCGKEDYEKIYSYQRDGETR